MFALFEDDFIIIHGDDNRLNKTHKPYKLSIKPRSFLFPCGPQQRSRHNRRAFHTR